MRSFRALFLTVPKQARSLPTQWRATAGPVHCAKHRRTNRRISTHHPRKVRIKPIVLANVSLAGVSGPDNCKVSARVESTTTDPAPYPAGIFSFWGWWQRLQAITFCNARERVSYMRGWCYRCNSPVPVATWWLHGALKRHNEKSLLPI